MQDYNITEPHYIVIDMRAARDAAAHPHHCTSKLLAIFALKHVYATSYLGRCPWQPRYRIDAVLSVPPHRATPTNRSQQQQASVRREATMVDCRKPGCNGKLQANGPVVVCPSCRSVNCLKCTAVHEGMSCKEYMRSISADVSQVQRTVNRGDQKLTQQSAAPLPSTSAATPGPSSKKTPMAPPAVTTDNDSSEMLANCKVEECTGMAFVDKDADMFRCQLCNHYTCVKCSAVHESMTCADYQRNKDNVPVPVFKPAASPEEGDEDSDSQEEQPEANGDAEGMIVECRYEGCAGYAYVVKTATTAQCELCKHWTCVACKVCHESQTCDQYKGIDVPAETMARQPPVPSKASQIPARSGTRKQKQENGAGNSGGGIFSAAMKSLFSRKAADAQSEPEGAKAAADNSSVATRAAQLGLYRDAKIVQIEMFPDD